VKVMLMVDGALDQVSGGYVYDRQVVDYLRAQGDDVEDVSLPTGSYLSRFRANLDPSLLKRLTEAGADVVVQDELSHPGLIALNRNFRRRSRTPIVTIVHHLRSSEPAPWPLPGVYASIERAYLRSVDGFVFNSRATRRVVERLVGDAAPAVVAPPAGDRFQPLPTDEEVLNRARQAGPLRLLFVGNMIRRKGLLSLLDALVSVDASLARLTVVGDAGFEPGYADAVRRRMARDGLAERVEWLGPLYDGRLAASMAASHVLVVPSTYEGFGIVYLEGMGFGLPAIGGAAGGAAEIIRDGENGFLIPPGDSMALAGRLRRLAGDRSLLAAMSMAAISTFRSHATWAQTGQTVRQFLADLTARGAPAAEFQSKEGL
jgi:glycosyltransferase involved in cell wall biosynthesis